METVPIESLIFLANLEVLMPSSILHVTPV